MSMFDVLVVGAGPAGSALAIELAQRGHTVALADRKAFPRQKPCGEFLSPACRPYLGALGVDAELLQLGTRRIHGMRLFRGDRAASGHFEMVDDAAHSTAGYAVRREVLDLRLLTAARAQPAVRWFERHAFAMLQRNADGRVSGALLHDPDRKAVSIAARFVVGADGVHSRVAHQLGWQRQLPWLDRMALVSRFAGVTPRTDAEVHFVGRDYFALTSVDDGTLHLNLVVDRPRLAGCHDVDALVAGSLAGAPRLQATLAAARRVSPWRGVGPLAFRTTRQAAPGVALVGDAAGYLDPLTGEGIYFALHGARALAHAVDLALREPQRERARLRDYERQYRREVGPRRLLAALLQRGLRIDWCADRTLALLARCPRLCDLLITMTGDCIHPRDLLRPGFWQRRRTLAVTT